MAAYLSCYKAARALQTSCRSKSPRPLCRMLQKKLNSSSRWKGWFSSIKRGTKQESGVITHVFQTSTNCCQGSAFLTPGSGFFLERRCQRGESWQRKQWNFSSAMEIYIKSQGAEPNYNRWVGCTHTFLCLRIRFPSGPNTVQVLYNFIPSCSGIDPEE